jgi:FlaA1/EpsC-like NDP-sugar epimerase
MVGKLRDMRDQSRRVLILGSGPLATTLIEEIESAADPRYIVAGTVDDQEPASGAPDHYRWLGTVRSLPEIINRVHRRSSS